MKQELKTQLKFQKRISTRISILFALAIMLSVVVIGYYGYNNARSAYIQNSIIASEESVVKLSSVLEGYMQPTVSDLNFLTDFYALKQFIHWHDIGEKSKKNCWLDVTIDAFTSFLISKKRYYKIRYLDMTGREIIRLNYDMSDDSVNATPVSQLQSKIHRDYFQQAIKLIEGSVYVSPFNLNREFGKIEFPYKPTIRFSMPVVDLHGQHRGVVVINMIGDKVLDKIAAHDKHIEQDNFLLLNKAGFYLYHSEKEKRFGFDLGNKKTIETNYPLLFKAIQENESGDLIENNEIISYAHIHPGRNISDDGNYLIVVNKTRKSFALEKLYEFELAFTILVLFILTGLFFIVRWIAKILSPLESVSQHLYLLSEGQLPKQKLSKRSDDEVGLIVSSTNILLENISATINQANAIAAGDFTKQVTVRSEQDELNTAINAMTRRLSDVAVLAERLSKGDYAQEIQVIDQNDSLGIALKNMLFYLSEIARVTESIAIGDFNYHYELASSDDRLGLSISQMQETLHSVVAQANAIAQGDFSQSITPKSDKDELGEALLAMTGILSTTWKKNEQDLWLKEGVNLFSTSLANIKELDQMAEKAIRFVAQYIDASMGVLYLFNTDDEILELHASYAYTNRTSLSNRFKIGEGVVGQVALEMKPILLQQSANNLSTVQSGTQQFDIFQTYTYPLINEGKLFGVAEVASLKKITDIQKEYLTQTASNFAAIMNSVERNIQISELLDKSQRDFEEMQMKSEELQQTNVQMEEQAQQLQMQAEDMKNQNASLVRTKAELDKQAEELIQASQYKSEFLANMSHELRTPLNSIILLSKMLRDGLKDKEQGKKASVIYSAGNDLLLLINDILDLSKIEAGKMDVELKKISTAQMCLQLKELLEPVANNKNLDFIIQDDLNSSFNLDEVKVMQVLKNLVSNAIKFTNKGSVTVHTYNGNGKLNFAVSDTGIGIPENKAEHVFEAFKQVDGSITREYGGTGLGLSISLRFARLMGGSLTLEKTSEDGSTFILSIPKEPAVENPGLTEPASELYTPQVHYEQHFEQDDEEENESTSEHSFEGNTLLLVDDDSRNIFALSALFQEAGAQTLHALNGHEALDILQDRSEVIDLILMDIMMPKMDGYDAIRKIRENRLYNAIPIIAVTAKAMDEDRQKCLDIGANDYVVKPVNEESLMQLSRLWIDKMSQ